MASLAEPTGTRRSDLTDLVTGIDRQNLDLVLAALAHAAGSDEQADLEVADDSQSARFVRLPSLHPWPDASPGRSASSAMASDGTTAERSRPLGR